MPGLMQITPYHARYYALLLSRRPSGVERYLPALLSANIDLHPHQVEAALFASRSPFRNGVILADEEGLGKTIEAGIALLQAYLEGRKRLLVCCPPNLVDHWCDELAEKFGLAALPLESTEEAEGVVILGYTDAFRQADDLARVVWDLVVLDEAHQLAHAGGGEHAQSDALRHALRGRPKLLLTATPMQNSVMDLYHLIRFVDETTVIGDAEAFKDRYVGKKTNRAELADRAQRICQRTLRKHTLTWPTTRRMVRTLLIEPSAEETAVSKRLSAYFHRDPLLAFPKAQEHEIRLMYWKMLASSPRALAESLDRLVTRVATIPGAEEERDELRAIAEQARAIGPGARAHAFLTALSESMDKLREAGAPEKAVVFSENRTTLDFLNEWLSAHGYRERIAVYQSGAAGKKALKAFADGTAAILLATDAAGAGVDLSHCALVVNYDLPWNVQKLEQRISRCHRYGQRHDVLVCNFLDPTNRADRRLYDTLNQKMKRFDDLFGATETILGRVGDEAVPTDALRKAAQIQVDQAAEKAIQKEEIARQEQQAEADLLVHFGAEVRARFKRYGQTIPKALSQMEGWLWTITRWRLGSRATFNDDERRFLMERSPYSDLRLSRITFGMDKTLPVPERYRLNHPLAKRVLADCLNGDLMRGRLALKASGKYPAGLSGELGLWLLDAMNEVAHETQPVLCGVTEDGQPISAEDCAGLMKLPVLSYDGGPVYPEVGEAYRGRVWRNAEPATNQHQPLSTGPLAAAYDREREGAQADFLSRQDAALSAELDRLRTWAQDEEATLSARQDEFRRRIAALKKKAAATGVFTERFELNQEAAELEKERRVDEDRQLSIMEQVRARRDALMTEAKRKTTARFTERELFVVTFSVESGR